MLKIIATERTPASFDAFFVPANDENRRAAILTSVENMKKNTCLKFTEIKPTDGNPPYYILFVDQLSR